METLVKNNECTWALIKQLIIKTHYKGDAAGSKISMKYNTMLRYNSCVPSLGLSSSPVLNLIHVSILRSKQISCSVFSVPQSCILPWPQRHSCSTHGLRIHGLFTLEKPSSKKVPRGLAVGCLFPSVSEQFSVLSKSQPKQNFRLL